MISTGKVARRQFGTRANAKRGKARRVGSRKSFGKLPISASRGNAEAFIRGGAA